MRVWPALLAAPLVKLVEYGFLLLIVMLPAGMEGRVIHSDYHKEHSCLLRAYACCSYVLRATYRLSFCVANLEI